VSHDSFLEQKIYTYLCDHSLREPAILSDLRERTAQLPLAFMQVPPEQGQFLSFLIQLMKARKTLEIGVFTGYSTLCTALALPPDGKIIACDINEEWATIAQHYWQQAGVTKKIDLRLAPALDTLHILLETAQANSFDFIFIDADKENYDAYYVHALQLIRPGGLIVIDNIFWGGKVVDPGYQDSETSALRDITEKLYADARISLSLVPIADGLLLALKRPV
jgi:predicted O-methyltransferase YrrM